jgi:hypothetical protein
MVSQPPDRAHLASDHPDPGVRQRLLPARQLARPVARNWVGMSAFSLAAITDWFDGYLRASSARSARSARSSTRSPTS